MRPVSFAFIILALASSSLLAADLNVRDFGAKGDGVTDDTAAIQAAFAAAQKNIISQQPWEGQPYVSSLPVLHFPNGKYLLSAPLRPTCHMSGEGNAVLYQPDPKLDIIVFDNCWRWRLDGFTFLGGHDHLKLGNSDIDTGRIVIDRCVFQNASGVAIRMGDHTFSTLLTVSNCVFYNCLQVLINWCDMAGVTDTWITTARDMKNQAAIENHGWLTMEHVLGVPMVVEANDQRWIDNYNGVTCRDFRFGGEFGGFTAVVNKSHYNYTYPIHPNYVRLDACQVYCINNPKRRAAIWCDEIPNQIVVRDCTGFPDLPVVRVSDKLDLSTYFKEAEARGEVCLRYFIDPAQVELRLPELPEPMRKYQVK